MRLGVLVLSGISRDRLESVLGPADWCFQPTTASGRDAKCFEPGWDFFYLPSGWLGGGANLVCLTRDGRTCRFVHWQLTA
jgi:hypothetical protein